MPETISAMERILRFMAKKNASDVYLSANAPLTIRVQGHCTPADDKLLPRGTTLDLLSEILPPERINELKSTGELNLAMRLSDVGNYRISAMRQRGTYAAVIRYISAEIPRFETLNLPPVLRELVMAPRGLILLVGATGTGKSTTLASLLDYRNQRVAGHILTIEDPIEYTFVNKKSIINQREVGSDTTSLEAALRNGLRQAPDVIMIGEIRDQHTMTAALAYAQSGHLCLATLHANNSYHALNRILSFYPAEVRSMLLGDLAAALKSIVSQRLIPTADGTRRVPATEILLNTDLTAEMIESGNFSDVKEAMENSISEGSQTFEKDIARLIRSGVIRRVDGMTFADSPTNLMWRLQNEQKQAHRAPARAEPPVGGTGGAPSFSDFTLDSAPAAARAAHGPT